METKVRLSDPDINLIDRVAELTDIDYKTDEDGWIEVDDIISALDRMTNMYQDTEDKFKEFTHDVDENYKRVRGSEYEYGE